MLNVQSWNANPALNAKGDDSTDDSNALQAAFDAATTSGTRDEVFFPPGTYRITRELLIGRNTTATDAPIFMRGCGTLSAIKLMNVSQNGVHIYSQNPDVISDLAFISAQGAGQSGGVMLYLDSVPPSPPTQTPKPTNFGSRFRNLYFEKPSTGFFADKAAGYVIDSCRFLNPNSQAIYISNTAVTDSGDITVSACDFVNNATAGTYGISYAPAGGLRVINNKFNGFQFSIVATLPAGVSTSDLLITGNSIENYLSAGVILQQASAGSNTFYNLSVVGNEFMTSSSNSIGLTSYGTSAWLNNVTITGNNFWLNGKDAETGLIGLHLEAINNLVVSGNAFVGYGTNTATFVGLQVAASCNTGDVGYNTYKQIGTPYTVTPASVHNHT